RLSRREFNKLVALGLGLSATGLPPLVTEAGAAQPGLAALDPTLPLHPSLQYGAMVEPDKKVDVIVQKVRKGDKGGDIAAAGEGEDLEEFGLVKAHHMRIKQGKLPKVAKRKDVLYIGPNATVQRHALTPPDPSKLKTTYPRTVNADRVWTNKDFGTTGAGVTVAVLDTGLTVGGDFGAGVIPVNLNNRTGSVADAHGHGTHVAGIIKGCNAAGTYVGVAPDATLISAKIADDRGTATTADLLRGLQWLYDNRAGYGGSGPIKVVNLSVTVGTPESYKTSAVCAAVEQLWFAGIVVVCAAGNRGTAPDATWYPPSNDPYVITAGATDEINDEKVGNDQLTVFSGRGKTQDGVYKPDIVAPGRQIYSALASANCEIARLYPERLTADGHIRLTGTSMSAPVVAGVVALLRSRFPGLTPDQIKWLLQNKALPYRSPDGVPIVAAEQAALWAKDPKNVIGKANQGLTPNINVVTGSSGVGFTQSYWDNGYWDQSYWDNGYWDNGYWDNAYWDTASWDMGLGYD
ncbi:MAG TPA: S8 family peptidase, partial [Thermomicrobiales bacterium]